MPETSLTSLVGSNIKPARSFKFDYNQQFNIIINLLFGRLALASLK
jgi:hypothetical protein